MSGTKVLAETLGKNGHQGVNSTKELVRYPRCTIVRPFPKRESSNRNRATEHNKAIDRELFETY
jgi:hypothetical protein